MIKISNRKSSCVDSLSVNPQNGEVQATFKSGGTYKYEGVDRSAIKDLLNNAEASLGQWLNANCSDGTRLEEAAAAAV